MWAICTDTVVEGIVEEGEESAVELGLQPGRILQGAAQQQTIESSNQVDQRSEGTTTII